MTKRAGLNTILCQLPFILATAVSCSGSPEPSACSANSAAGSSGTDPCASGGAAATGGASTGGVATGGVATGGVATGGASTGGATTGGVATGGAATGGTATGGAATGGAATGGAATGGAGGTGTSPWSSYSVSCSILDQDADGFSPCQGDCDDGNAAVATLPLVVDAAASAPGDGTLGKPYQTIAQAVAALGARTCRSITLRPGIYTDSTVTAPRLTLTSTDGPAVTFWQPPSGQYAINYANTGDLVFRGITVRSGTTTRSRGITFSAPSSGSALCGNLTVEASVFDNLDRTILMFECNGLMTFRGNVFKNNTNQGNSSFYYVGGAINDSATYGTMSFDIEDNLFQGNTNYNGGKGAAIALLHGGAIIQGNTFFDNTSVSDAGAVFIFASGGSTDLSVRQNFFGANNANGSGGALYLSVSTNANTTIQNNIFNANGATSDGGALYVSAEVGTSRLMVNNTFVDNWANRGGHVYMNSWPGTVMANAFIFSRGGGGVTANSWTTTTAAPTFTFNDTYQNFPDWGGALTSITITGQNGNLAVDPGFVTLVDDTDPNNDNLHLSAGSALIDAGPPRPNTWNDPDGSVNDIGAYGGPYAKW